MIKQYKFSNFSGIETKNSESLHYLDPKDKNPFLIKNTDYFLIKFFRDFYKFYWKNISKKINKQITQNVNLQGNP